MYILKIKIENMNLIKKSVSSILEEICERSGYFPNSNMTWT